MPIDMRFFACFKIFKKVLKKVLTLSDIRRIM
nr:MAG TPA: hypothetical protein [Caudoviricetes sp.]